jgi:hypothetical protein
MNEFVGCDTAFLVTVHIEMPFTRDTYLTFSENTSSLVLALYLFIFSAIGKDVFGVRRKLNEQPLFQLAVDDGSLRIGEVRAIKYQAGLLLAVEFEARIGAAA